MRGSRGVVLSVAGVVLAAGCSQSSGGGSADRDAAPPPAAATDTVTAETRAKVGQPITVAGVDDGASVRITVLAYRKGVKADEPSGAGARFDAVQYRVTNSGSAVYDDSPSNGARVRDAQGKQFEAEPVTETEAGADFPTPTTLRPGRSATGWSVFRVAAKARITAVMITSDSGFGGTGEWTLA